MTRTLGESIGALLDRLPKAAVVALALSLVALVGAIDRATGNEIAFSIFYLIPVSLAAWLLGGMAGVGFSFLASMTWLAADLAGGTVYTSPLIPCWNALVRLGFFLVTCAL